MKNLGIRLSNQELLSIRGGAFFSCFCDSGLEYVVETGTLAEAEATLATRCTDPHPSDFCEPDDGMG